MLFSYLLNCLYICPCRQSDEVCQYLGQSFVDYLDGDSFAFASATLSVTFASEISTISERISLHVIARLCKSRGNLRAPRNDVLITDNHVQMSFLILLNGFWSERINFANLCAVLCLLHMEDGKFK